MGTPIRQSDNMCSLVAAKTECLLFVSATLALGLAGIG